MVLTSHLCVSNSSQEKRRLLLYTLTDWLCITEVECVYCAVRIESLHIQQTSLVFKDAIRSWGSAVGVWQWSSEDSDLRDNWLFD